MRFEWGPSGASALASGCRVVVDVLSFTTSVAIAAERGTHVFPYRWRDGTAAAFAASHDARLAVGRSEVSAESPWSLSPAALRRAPFADRLVLPSPNGSTIAVAAADDVPVVAGCLRNATATARALSARGWGTADRPVNVIAAGERWPDGSLRPALEDLLGAGAIIAALHGRGCGPLSPEAAAARAAYEATTDLPSTLANCASGRELNAIGHLEDVEIAAELDTTDAVPALTGDGRGRWFSVGGGVRTVVDRGSVCPVGSSGDRPWWAQFSRWRERLRMPSSSMVSGSGSTQAWSRRVRSSVSRSVPMRTRLVARGPFHLVFSNAA